MKCINGWAIPEADTYFAPFLREQGGFEVDHLIGLLPYVTDWSRAIDGGASIGTWSRLMATHFAEVLAYEPAPDTYACLVRNLTDWPNVTCYRVALSDHAGHCGLSDSLTRTGNTGARHLTPGTGVDTITIDSLNLPSLGLLKLDVEGEEERAVKGAKETILRCNPIVMVEVKLFKDTETRLPSDPSAVGRLLESLGMHKAAQFGNDVVFAWP